ncbi:MAG: immunity protein Tsi6 family protein [Gammaproteobacteria bacterium]
MDILLNVKKAKETVYTLLEENPDFDLWKSIYAQLDFILSDFDSTGKHKRMANKDRVREIILGVQAIREIEAGNPELADLLCNIDYEYKKYYGVS